MRKEHVFFTAFILLLLNSLSIEASNNIKEIKELEKSIKNSTMPIVLHNEVVGTFVFEQYSEKLLLLTAIVEKKHLTLALKMEGDCELQDMMRVCGNKYLQENFGVKVNDENVVLKQESLSVEKDMVTVAYTIPISKEAIKEIEVTSDYMFKYNDHSLLKVIFNMGGRIRNFNIKNKRRTITASFVE